MTEHSKYHRIIPHVFLILAIFIIVFPIFVVFIASTHTSAEILSAPMPLTPGDKFIENYSRALLEGSENMGASAVTMIKNSLIMALGIAFGKIIISLLAAFAIVFFNFPLKNSASGASS